MKIRAYGSKALANIIVNIPTKQNKTIDDSHYRLILKLGKEMQINHHSLKEHTEISKITKFGCEML
jgi:hypothetical protein